MVSEQLCTLVYSKFEAGIQSVLGLFNVDEQRHVYRLALNMLLGERFPYFWYGPNKIGFMPI